MKRVKILFLLILRGTASMAQHRVPLNAGWQFKKAGENSWNEARVPGSVHTDLLNNKLIPEPFAGNNEKTLQWIEQENWDYKTYFDFDISATNAELIFEGLDTY